MVIVNPFDLLGVGDEEENYDNDEVLFREAEKKALEDAKVNAAAKEIAKFASLRAAAEKEDRDRTEAKNREERERRKAAFLDRKKKEKEEEEKKLKEQSASDTTSVSSDIAVENKKVKVRKPTIKVFPGDCEKPRLPPLLPQKKYVETPTVHVYGTTGASYDRPSSRQSDRASGYEEGSVTENYEQKSDVESYGQNAYENGNAGYGDYKRPLTRNRTRRYRNTDTPARSVNGKRDGEPLPTPGPEGNALPEESLEKSEVVVPDDNKVQVNVEKNEPAVSDADNEKKEEVKMTLREYLQGLEEQRKKLPATEERKVQIDSELKKMKQLSLKKGGDEIFIKLSSHKDCGNRKKASVASGKDAKEKSISSTAFFRYHKYQRPQPQPQPRPFTEGDGGETTNGNQGKGREQGEKGLPAAAPYNGSQGRGKFQQRTAAQKAPYRGNPPVARGGGYGGQSRWSGGPYEGNQRRGSNGDARAEALDIKKDFPPLKTE